MRVIENAPDLYDDMPDYVFYEMAPPPEVFVEAGAASRPSEEDGDGLERVDWADLFEGVEYETPVVEGLLFAGRWTAVAAAAKAGKSTLSLAVAVSLATGMDPFTGTARDRVPVLYLDAEMGRVDILERLREEHQVEASDLGSFHYVDLVPTLNTVVGAGRTLNYVDEHAIKVVILDGINGAVDGAEKDDDTWRPFYNLLVAELKRRSVAVFTCDNLGKDETLGPRGSSVKMDKADAVIRLSRTDAGVKLGATHRRTASYPLRTDLEASGLDGEGPIRFRYASGSWPAGTAAKAAELDRAGVPVDVSRQKAAEALRSAGLTPGKNDVLAAALRYRRTPEYMLPEVAE